MAQTAYFSKEQMKIVNEASDLAEEFVISYFGLNWDEWKCCHYDLKTQEFQNQKERTNRALAQVCKYECSPPESSESSELDFYRICLQDRLIIKTTEERSDRVKLAPLLLYIITHELTHIMRFTQFEQEFDVKKEAKVREEKEVHNLTYDILAPISEKKIKILKPVLEGFKSHRELKAN